MTFTALVFEEVVQIAAWGETLMLCVRGLRGLKQRHERWVELDLTHGLQLERVIVHLREHESEVQVPEQMHGTSGCWLRVIFEELVVEIQGKHRVLET
jgi:hypothetical protein